MSVINIKEGALAPDPATPDFAELEPLIQGEIELIPLNGKVPIGHWRDRAPMSSEDAYKHMVRGGNVGVRLNGRLAVFDYDRRRDEAGVQLDTLKDEIRRACDINPDHLVTVRTGGGGEHIYFLLPEGISPTSLRKTTDGLEAVELLRKGQQVVAPGSVHPETGLMYELLDPDDATIDTVVDVRLMFGGDYVGDSRRTRSATGNVIELPVPAMPRKVIEQLAEAVDPDIMDDYNDWVRLGMALHSQSTGEQWGLDLWMKKSWQDSTTLQSCIEKWNSFARYDGRRVGLGELEKFAQKSGLELWTVEPCHETAVADFAELTDEECANDTALKPIEVEVLTPDVIPLRTGRSGEPANTYQSAVNVLQQLQPVLVLAFNELRGRAVFRGSILPWNDRGISNDLTDDTLRLLRLVIISQFGLELSKEHLSEAALAMAYMNRWNPVEEYLAGLEWDGEPRVDGMLTDLFGADDSDYTRAVSRLLLVAAVRRALKPGCKYDTMVVLEGRQGAGKSTGLRALCPDVDWFTDASLHLGPNTDSGKSTIALEGSWIVEMAELETLNKGETARIKAWLSRSRDDFRRPYDRHRTESPRRFVVVGTTNESGYLIDATGNRRYLPVSLKGEIDVEGVALERDQVWAEAVAIERDYGALILPRELWSAAAERQADRVAEHPWVALLRDALDGKAPLYDHRAIEVSPKGAPIDKVHADWLLGLVGVPTGRSAQAHSKLLRQLMESTLGWEYRRSLRVGDRVGAGYVRPSSEGEQGSFDL